MTRASSGIVCVLVLFGCAGEPSEARPATLVTHEGEGTTRADVETAPVLAPPAASDRPLVAAHALAAGLAEDGDGHTIQAAAPIAIDLDAHAFPPRALDPVLTIGQARFTHYSHPHAGVLRFVIASAALLGGEMRVAYARDGSDARVVLAAGETLAVTP